MPENKCGKCAVQDCMGSHNGGMFCASFRPKYPPERRVFVIEGYVLKNAFDLWPIKMDERGICKSPMIFNLKSDEKPEDFIRVKVTWEVLK